MNKGNLPLLLKSYVCPRECKKQDTTLFRYSVIKVLHECACYAHPPLRRHAFVDHAIALLHLCMLLQVLAKPLEWTLIIDIDYLVLSVVVF